jgi:methionyl-tRNA formyltransferase
MRIVIAGGHGFAADVLALCLRRGDDVAAVLPPAPGDRLAQAAGAAGIAVVCCARRVEAAHVPECDLILSAYCHAWITSAARARARLGALGYHPSLLPRHRGRDAVRWTIHMRDAIAGGTAYWMDDGADTGTIAAQDWCHVRQTDNPATLWRRELAPIGLRLIAKVLSGIDQGIVTCVPQNETCATWEPAFSTWKLSVKR